MDFQEKPLGTASLAQVHKARLRVRPPQEDEEPRSIPPKDLAIYKDVHEDDDDDEDEDEDEEDDTKGPWVAVKVQHRYVRNHSFVDIYTMDFLVRAVKWWFPQVSFKNPLLDDKNSCIMYVSFLVRVHVAG